MLIAARAMRALGLLGALAGVAGCSRPQPEAPKVATIERVADRLYVIKGGGGNTAALVTRAGVVLVDTKLPGWGPAIIDALKTVTDQPVTTIINTHPHSDHVDGDTAFPPSVNIVAQENTRRYMAAMPEFQGENARFLPKTTYRDHLTLTVGDDRLELYHVGAAHTDGDTVVVFPALRIAHTGDLFPGKNPPIVVRLQGGSTLEYPATVARLEKVLADVDGIIPGHWDTLLTRDDLHRFQQFNQALVAWTEAQHQAGTAAKTAAFAFTVPPAYHDFVDTWRVTTTVQLIYQELDHEPARPLNRPWWKFW